MPPFTLSHMGALKRSVPQGGGVDFTSLHFFSVVIAQIIKLSVAIDFNTNS